MTKEIPIRWKDQVHTVLVDDDAYQLLSRHTWYIMYSGKKKNPYAFAEVWSRTQGKRMIYMHHLVMGSFCQTDHINQNTLDNQFHNLRWASHSQNGANVAKWPNRKGKKMSSKYKGVFFDTRLGKWRAGVMKDRKKHDLGSFDDEDAAGLAYNAKARELHGEFAWQNPVPGTNHHAPTRDSE